MPTVHDKIDNVVLRVDTQMWNRNKTSMMDLFQQRVKAFVVHIAREGARDDERDP